MQFDEIRKQILRWGIEIATSAQRDRFVENPVDQVNIFCFYFCFILLSHIIKMLICL